MTIARRVLILILSIRFKHLILYSGSIDVELLKYLDILIFDPYMLRLIKFCKDALIAFPLTLVLLPFEKFFGFVYYYNKLVLWIWKNKSKIEFCDFYSPFRNYNKRYNLYNQILKKYNLHGQAICYIEFGVASGASFKWWLEKNSNQDSRFFGFDTFEGLPEKWGSFGQGSMSFTIPELSDNRASFVPGLFQNTLTTFINTHLLLLNSESRKIIHMDADLYSATIFSLSQLYPFLKEGDLILYDEFNVAMHEYKAHDEFTRNFYIRAEPVAAVNNFYQVCFEVHK